MAQQYKYTMRYEDAIELLENASVDGDTLLMSELADCYMQSGDLAKACGLYAQLAEMNPDNISFKVRLMQCQYRSKSWPQAIMAGKMVLQQDSIPAVVSLIGDAYRHLDQRDSALRYYNISLTLRPKSPNTVAKVADLLLAGKDYDGVLSVTSDYLSTDPDNFDIAPRKAAACYHKEYYRSAAEILQKQEDLGNGGYSIHYYLGMSYWKLGDFKYAGPELVQAWQADSSSVSLAMSIASVRQDDRRPFFSEIKPWLDRAYEMTKPDSTALSLIHRQYARGYSETSADWDEAIAHFKEQYRYSPGSISAILEIAYCYEMKRDYRNALAWYEKYLKRSKPDTAGYRYASKEIEFPKSELFMEQ